MFGKMMNNYYYGKSGKGDYQKDDLPRNRKQQFFEMLRIRFAGLFRMNLMTAVAFLPLLYVLMVMLDSLLGHMVLLADATAAGTVITPEQEELVKNSPQLIYNILFSGFTLLIPAIAITGPVQAGMAYVTRNWARDEHAFVWSDFKDAVKANWKQALGVSLITGLLPLILLVCYQFYGSLGQNNVLFIVPQMLAIALGLVWMLALVYLYPLMVTYQMGFGTLIRNALLLSVGRLPHTAAARLIMLVPSLLAALVAFVTPYTMYAVMGLFGYYLLLGNALARFVYAAVTNAAFDRFINPRIAGVEVDRGLSREDEDEDLEDEPDEELQTPHVP